MDWSVTEGILGIESIISSVSPSLCLSPFLSPAFLHSPLPLSLCLLHTEPACPISACPPTLSHISRGLMFLCTDTPALRSEFIQHPFPVQLIPSAKANFEPGNVRSMPTARHTGGDAQALEGGVWLQVWELPGSGSPEPGLELCCALKQPLATCGC